MACRGPEWPVSPPSSGTRPGCSHVERHLPLSGAALPLSQAQDDTCVSVCFWLLNFRIHLCSSFRCGTGIQCCYGPRHGNPNVRVTLPLPRSHSANMGEPRGPGIIPNTGWGSSRPTSGKPQRRVRMCKCADKPARSGACPKPPIRHAALLGFEPKPVTSERVFFTVKLRRVCVPLSDLGLSSIDVWAG